MTVPPDPVSPPLARAELDRRGDERETEGLLASAQADPGSRVLVLRGDAAPLADADGSALRYSSPDAVAPGGEWAFLGRDTDGAAMLLAAFPRDADEPVEAPHGWGALRAVGGGLPDFDAGVFVEGLSLGRWLLDAPFCPACGTRDRDRQGGLEPPVPRLRARALPPHGPRGDRRDRQRGRGSTAPGIERPLGR